MSDQEPWFTVFNILVALVIFMVLKGVYYIAKGWK
jgi:hypothetical protein